MRTYILRKYSNVEILNNSNQKHAGNEIPRVEKMVGSINQFTPDIRFTLDQSPAKSRSSITSTLYLGCQPCVKFQNDLITGKRDFKRLEFCLNSV